VGRKLGELWPGDLCEQLAAHGPNSDQPSGVLQLYKYLLKEKDATLNIAVHR